jgi:hypothetical protein
MQSYVVMTLHLLGDGTARSRPINLTLDPYLFREHPMSCNKSLKVPVPGHLKVNS